MRRHAHIGALAALTATLAGLAAADPSVPVAYCASVNTATMSANSSTFQSEGLCFDYCNDDGYALGVLQDSDCWCSNYVPATSDQVSTSKCETPCPGYPDDYCGGDDLFGYMSLSAAVSGTAAAGGGTSTSAKSTSTTSTSATGTTIITPPETITETLQASVTTTSSSDPSTSSTSLTSPQSAETKSSSTSAEADTTSSQSKSSLSVFTSVQTVTSEGSVTTQTIVTTAVAESSSDNGLAKGAIAGLVIGILALIAAFIAGAILYRRHRKNQMLQEQAPLNAALAGSHRRGSSAGIMSKAGTISSSGYGLAMEEDMSYASPSRRISMKPLDPRLDPSQMFGLYRAASHDSINTIRDDQDYSRRIQEAPRVLRVTNSDPLD